MNTFFHVAHLVVTAGLVYACVQLAIRLRLHRRQLANLLAHHDNLRQRFGLFMLNGGQDVTKKHFNKKWEKSQSAVKAGPAPTFIPHDEPESCGTLIEGTHCE
jgi:hypothetical protein